MHLYLINPNNPLVSLANVHENRWKPKKIIALKRLHRRYQS